MSGSNAVLPTDLVDVLIQEPILISKWKQFARYLDVPEAELNPLDIAYRNGTIQIHDLFMRIIQVWISKCGDTATFEALLLILRANHFNQAADLLVKKLSIHLDGKSDERTISKLSGLKIIPVQKNNVNSHRASSPNGKPTPIWYKMTTSNQSAQKLEAELQYLHQYFEERTSPTLKVILVSGEELIGKSELCRHFGCDLYSNQSVSCIWIEGANGESEMTDFLASLHTNLNDLSQTLIHNGSYPWVIIFDGRLKDKISYMKTVLDNFRKYPPRQQPFVIITTRMYNIEELQYTLFSNGYFRTIKFPRWLDLIDKEGLMNFLKNYVTPYVLEKGGGKKHYMETCTKVNLAFELSDVDPNQFIKRETGLDILPKTDFDLSEIKKLLRDSIFCLITIISGHLSDVVYLKFCILLCKTVFKNTDGQLDPIFTHVINSFVNARVISKSSTDQITMPDEEMNSVITMYLDHPGIQSITSDLFDETTLNAIASLKELYQNFIKLQSGSGVDVVDVKNLLTQAIKHDILIHEFKKEMIIILLELKKSVELCKSVYKSYVRLFGKEDEESLKAGEELAKSFYNSYMWNECGEMYRVLYEIKKVKYGNVDQKTLEDGEWAARGFSKAEMKSDVIKIVREIAQNCENQLGLRNETTLENKYRLANALKGDGKVDDALLIYQEILPISIQVKGPEGDLTKWVKDRISEIKIILKPT